MGGEKVQILLYEDIQKGSPPRGRGKVAGDEIPGDVLGITPAHAGKRTRSWRAYGCPWDHPRVGGEKSTFLNSMSFPPGSPPRRRGKVPNARCFIERQRITPAWAGKSAFRFQSQKASQDHPRMGGEKSCPGVTTNSLKGSPPRRRGKGGLKKNLVCGIRITPARAGKSPRRSRRAAPARDHPRVGGEKWLARKFCHAV